MICLGIETSCDDTSLAILKKDSEGNINILYEKKYTQDEMLQKWGGVVPEIASRNHLDKLALITRLLKEDSPVFMNDIDLIAVTTHPGLLGPLLTGINFAKNLSLLFEKPIQGVNHLWAHLEAIHLTQKIEYPYLGVLVSGGHSFITFFEQNTQVILAKTLDDAAGEAFDKAGKMLGLPYPGGKWIDQLAQKGDPHKYPFSIGLAGKKDMSFSGLKTAIRNFIEKNNVHFNNQNQMLFDLCASYQETIVRTLIEKIDLVYSELPKDFPIVVGGGVACNSRLRMTLKEKYHNVYFVEPKYCEDNATMISHYALKHPQQTLPFPRCLELDAQNRFITK